MAESVLVTRNLTKRYGSATVVNNVNLNIEKGQIYGLVGRNGAGKTTIIRMVTAQTVPTEGEISLFGATEPGELGKMRARTGAMVETPSFYPYLTARENLEYYRIQRGIPGKNCVDEGMTYRRSHENPIVQQVYKEYLGEPGGHRAHELLHTTYVPQKRYRTE